VWRMRGLSYTAGTSLPGMGMCLLLRFPGRASPRGMTALRSCR
jgi:hypothetical protein